MIPRILEAQLKRAARKYWVVAILGPRQSGKTTLARHTFPQKPYVSLEDPDQRAFALEDPRRFLGQFPKGAVLDEAQRTPDIFSYIQTLVDEKRQAGLFILTGSQHFGLMEKISQSLAGRVALYKLLPFSMEELRPAGHLSATLHNLLFTGGYPPIYDKGFNPTEWFANYVETYLERDVRQLKNVGDISSFHRFLRMIAARCGQLLNLSSLASDCGITHNTAKSWLSVLEASFVVFPLSPHHKNFNKRLRKSPKIYFLDTGLLCYLLGVVKPKELAAHSMRGPIFENFILTELLKRSAGQGLAPNLFFWQDKLGREVDCILESAQGITPIEIKAGETINADYFKSLSYWAHLAGDKPGKAYIVYAGQHSQPRSQAMVLSWRELFKVPF